MVETVIALPLLIMVALGAAQWGLIYHAKSTLDHATFMAARFGALRNADPQAIQAGLNQGLLPLFSPNTNMADVNSMLGANGEVVSEMRQWSTIRILNPTHAAFDDFAVTRGGVRELPNTDLGSRATTPGGNSGLTIQDANLLKIRVMYGYRMRMPFVGGLISTGTSWANWILQTNDGSANDFRGLRARMLRNDRMPIVASATVRMQSPARENPIMAP
jgi:Flp pilus assembly protein TadG